MQSIQVAAGIIWKDGRFLAARRPAGKIRAGFWEFPGGKREPGESMAQTLRRELREELGIQCLRIVPWRVVRHEYPDVHVTLHFMHVLGYAGRLTPRDGQELRWLEPDQARTLDFLPADRELIPLIRHPGESPARP